MRLVGDDDGDRLADEAHDVGRQQRLVRAACVAGITSMHGSGGMPSGRSAAVSTSRVRGSARTASTLDADRRVRDRAAQHGGVQEPDALEVGDVAPAAAQQPRVLLALDARADELRTPTPRLIAQPALRDS